MDTKVPMDQTDQRSPKRDIFDMLFTHINRTLLVFKLFYFFFFAAFGSLFPLISIYFKQLGMNAVQSGLLSGIRPFIEFFSAPFWGGLADKWKKGKSLLLFTLICWIGFTLGIFFVKPAPEGCIAKIGTNGSREIVDPFPDLPKDRLLDESQIDYANIMGQSPIKLDYHKFINRDAENGANLVIPIYATVVYHQDSINQAFIVLMVIIVIGEFFSCPAISLADSAVLNYLAEERDSYGRQRLFGSLGWGLAMFFIGIALDHSTSFPDHPCKHPGEREKNYVICFTVFTVFMCFALITATQFKFTYDGSSESMYLKVMKDKVAEKILGGRTKNRQKLVNELDDDDFKRSTPGSQNAQPTDEDILERQLQIKLDRRGKDAVSDTVDPYAEDITTTQFAFSGWLEALKQFGNPRLAAFLFVAWFMGLGVGLVFTFLFWHLQELGGSPTLFGIASVINHISEIIAYYFSSKLIATIGHIKVLYLGLLGNVLRFLYVSWLTNPWWVLPFEFIQGLTHAAVWAACCSYITQSISKEFRSSSQGVLQGLHHGLGKGCGSVFGGLVIASYGSDKMFRVYGVTCCVVLLGFMAMNYFIAEIKPPLTGGTMPKSASGGQIVGLGPKEGDDDEPKEYLEESTYLSPHGIPFAPSNQELSRSPLHNTGRTGTGNPSSSSTSRPMNAQDLYTQSYNQSNY